MQDNSLSPGIFLWYMCTIYSIFTNAIWALYMHNMKALSTHLIYKVLTSLIIKYATWLLEKCYKFENNTFWHQVTVLSVSSLWREMQEIRASTTGIPKIKYSCILFHLHTLSKKKNTPKSPQNTMMMIIIMIQPPATATQSMGFFIFPLCDYINT